jgi:hydroxymethylbilane synthase
MSVTLRIGSRPSKLALAQTRSVAAQLQGILPELKIEIVPIKSSGDKLASASLAQVGGKGLFVKELEEALEDGRIDVAIHSMKDLPAKITPRFRLAAVPLREDRRDVLITRTGDGMAGLPRAARLGTSSPRRHAQVIRVRPDLQMQPLRGNVDTRLSRLANDELDAIVLAMAGLRRLGLAATTKLVELDLSTFVPAGGQGALAVEAVNEKRIAGSTEVENAIRKLNHQDSELEVTAERAFLAEIGATCSTPIGVSAIVDGQSLEIHAQLLSLDGSRLLDDRLARVIEHDVADIGVELARKMIAQGAREIIGG